MSAPSPASQASPTSRAPQPSAPTPPFAPGRAVAIWFGLFVLAAWPLTRIGDPESPALAALARLPVAPTVAIIGDSRAHVGLSPTLLDDGLHGHGLAAARTHNFAVDGTDVLHHFSFVLHGLLGVKTLPRVLIWAPNPLEFDDARRSNRLEQLRPSDLVPLFRAGAPLELLLDVATMALFLPYRHRPLVQVRFEDRSEKWGKRSLPLQSALFGLAPSEPPKSREYHAFPDGWEPFVVLDWADRFRRGAEAYRADYERLRLDDWHFALARRLLHEVRARGVEVVILELPVAPWFRTYLASGEKHRAWRAKLAMLAKEEGALLINEADLYDDDRQFGDPGHMSRPLAEAYSRRLAEHLANEPAIRAALER
jgi:hypothetical protein